MTTINNLPRDLVTEILSRILLTSLSVVRSTCKKWNVLSKTQIVAKGKAARKQLWGFIMMDSRVFSMRFDLQGIRNDEDLVDPSIQQIGIFNQIQISNIFHCDGLLLCVTEKKSRLVVWNPYLGQIRWIQPRKKMRQSGIYAFGYDNNHKRNHKILWFFGDFYYIDDLKSFCYWSEIYDFKSNSWRVLDVNPDWYMRYNENGMSLKGNTYFVAEDKIRKYREVEDFLICFDFTTESFGPRLRLPFHLYSEPFGTVTLSCVRDEQLAVLYQTYAATFDTMEIWVSTKIEPNAVSWSMFFKLDMTLLNGFPDGFASFFKAKSFFIDEEKKVAVVFDTNRYQLIEEDFVRTPYIIGEEGYVKTVKIRIPKYEVPKYTWQLVFSSYVPSLVQLEIKRQQRKRKQRDY